MSTRLYSYWRSSAAYRVRIALNLKGLDYELVPIKLVPGVDEHKSHDYLSRNPQGLIPFLEDDDVAIAQSMAILEYLEETYPELPLLPDDAGERAAVRSFCNSIACDIHPLNNLRVMLYLRGPLGADDEQFNAWYSHWIHEGFGPAEQFANRYSDDGSFVFGDAPTLADAFLVPQMYNARRFKVATDDYPTLVGIVDACNELVEFRSAAPESQPDAEH